jgi:hypothetical protein
VPTDREPDSGRANILQAKPRIPRGKDGENFSVELLDEGKDQ